MAGHGYRAICVVVLLGAAACEGPVEDGGGSGAGPADCPGACAKLSECIGEPAAGCVTECEADAAANPAMMAVCTSCFLGASCEQVFDNACAASCEGPDTTCEQDPAACPGCQTDEDCDAEAGEVCEVDLGACVMVCDTDTDCGAGERCCPGSICLDASFCGGGGGGGGDCPEGEGPDAAGECRPVCGSVADCYSLQAYCASDGLCYAVEACARGSLALPMDASGPLLFAPTQADLEPGVALCAKDPAACTANGNVCGWDLYFFDPDGDLPQTKAALYGKTSFIAADGSRSPAFNVDAPDVAREIVTVYGCFDELEASPVAAFQIDDLAGNHSNVVCVGGSAP